MIFKQTTVQKCDKIYIVGSELTKYLQYRKKQEYKQNIQHITTTVTIFAVQTTNQKLTRQHAEVPTSIDCHTQNSQTGQPADVTTNSCKFRCIF